MKVILAIILSFFLISPANSQYLKDDRYPNWDNKLTGKMIYKEVKYKKYKKKVKKFYRQKFHTYRRGHTARFLADAADVATTPIQRMSAAVIHAGRPSGCPARAWCGCWLIRHLGMQDRNLWLARNWARLGTAVAPSPGAVVVFARGRGGHVGKITAVEGNRIKVISGNDGRMVRERWRSMAGVIAVRRI